MASRWGLAVLGTGLVALNSSLISVAECMPYRGSGPKKLGELPKKKKRKEKRNLECVPMLLALLACYKASNYARGRCAVEEKVLMECAAAKTAEVKKTDTTRYHFIRLLKQLRRR
mmetsp:Transcript_47759/g.74509  ORF Transcript_47759/g.74509 Transcript_47759/m.74509 type:complete len:115 (-) Transcript_47759:238-582(-)|eukprot:CAMPEP_0184321862 /NCGR_PEP_ID=MMETSP1049-20130417/121528_1 /TAXON_ID=77928 /ORGANISM="Proteomonas sulcata, Strain CCMP704" /LENGTH=114 /DNA_ID=CAMNT_0026642833 /DNA_START=58 /DNA_END=402 /DNA_ORIENTATION=-